MQSVHSGNFHQPQESIHYTSEATISFARLLKINSNHFFKAGKWTYTRRLAKNSVYLSMVFKVYQLRYEPLSCLLSVARRNFLIIRSVGWIIHVPCHGGYNELERHISHINSRNPQDERFRSVVPGIWVTSMRLCRGLYELWNAVISTRVGTHPRRSRQSTLMINRVFNRQKWKSVYWIVCRFSASQVANWCCWWP